MKPELISIEKQQDGTWNVYIYADGELRDVARVFGLEGDETFFRLMMALEDMCLTNGVRLDSGRVSGDTGPDYGDMPATVIRWAKKRRKK